MKKLNFISVALLSLFLFFAGTIDLDSLLNYSNQSIPGYINQDNTPGNNPVTDAAATLGRVLFYDKNLSLTNTVSCGSCHKQEFAFGDDLIQSTGHDGGLTGRHSPRLSSSRFGEETKFFWDERALTLEEQSTMPLQDHIEMGFSGTNGDPTIDSLISKIGDLSYYDLLFEVAFGDQTVTEDRMQKAMAQFVRSMQSFDSKYDIGRAQVGNNNVNFPNFTTEENNGKSLYMSNNATGCNRCHRAPEFDIDPSSRNNGVIGVAGQPGILDLTNERSPSLRDIVNNNGDENGPYMHDGSLATLLDVINHYDDIPDNPANTNLDIRLNGNGGDLNLTTTEKNELLAFLKTLGGSNLYTDARWSDPFDNNGDIEILSTVLPVELAYFDAFHDDGDVQLEWETSLEVNNDGFEILHSHNTQDWTLIDFIDGQNEASQYEYTHIGPNAGTNYYRLKQIDINGQFSLSDITSVKIEERIEAFKVYPNPTNGMVTIEASEGYESALIFNTTGELLKKSRLEGKIQVDLSGLEDGIYFLHLLTDDGAQSQSQRIIKF